MKSVSGIDKLAHLSMSQKLLILIFVLVGFNTYSQKTYLLKPDRIFDGQEIHENWKVLVRADKIVAVGLDFEIPKEAEIIELKGCTLLPGFIKATRICFYTPTTKPLGTTKY